MEPSILFAGFILSMCAMHLVGRVSEQIAKWWAKNHPLDARRKTVRSDWYVFFSCADLLGKEPEKKQGQLRKSLDKDKAKHDRRPVARA